jgi:LysM repeat protein
MISLKKKILAIFLGVAGLHVVLILGIVMSGGCSSPKVMKSRGYVPDPAPAPLPHAAVLPPEPLVAPIPPAPVEKTAFPPFKAAPAKSVEHTVGNGESFWTIARKYGVDMKELAAVNKLPIDKPLKVGTKLMIPAGGTVPSASGAISAPAASASAPVSSKKSSASPKAASVPAAGGEYVVQKNDSLWKIAMMHNLKTETLASANNLDVRKPLKVGQKLIIPGGAKTATATAKSASVSSPVAKKAKPETAKTATPPEAKPTKTEAVDLATDLGVTDDVDMLTVDTSKQSADDIIDSLTKDEDAAVNLLLEDTEAPAASGQAFGPPPPPAAVSYAEHEVTRGETVDIIAGQYGMTPKQILDINPGLDAKGPLKEGSKIKIP